MRIGKLTGITSLIKFISILCVLLVCGHARKVSAAPCGDVDASGQLDITDAVYLINYIFAGGPAPQDDAAGDVDCNQQTDITDAVFLINYIFAGGAQPCVGPTCVQGVLLSGDPDSLALSATFDLYPIPADSSGVSEDGFIATKLEAIISGDAKIGEINSILNQYEARISSMVEGLPFVSLMLPAVQGRNEADSIADLLTASGAFLYVFAAYTPPVDNSVSLAGSPVGRTAITPGGQANSDIDHLIKLRMPAAWNIKDMIGVGNKVSVLVPDKYAMLTPNTQISAQEFVIEGATSTNIDANDYVIGNHGFHVSSIIAADFDVVGATGTHPDAQSHLELLSLPIEGLDFTDIMHGLTFNVSQYLPSGRFILNTSFGYNDPAFERMDKFKRVFDMLQWRLLVVDRQADFVHATAAGNSGQTSGDGGSAEFASPFCSASRFSSPMDLLAGEVLTPAQEIALTDLVARISQSNPEALLPLENVIIVGSNSVNGIEYFTSNRDPDVRCVGETVFGACALQDPVFVPFIADGCDGQNAYYTGTSQAAPQIAGLAAYLWNLNPLLTVPEIRGIICSSYVDGQVDAYRAVLSLDEDIGSAAVRLELLDVANSALGGIPGRDGVFDSCDIVLFLDQFALFENDRQANGEFPDYSRYDLNGDGYTGGTTYISKFDLDINSPPVYGPLSIPTATTQLEFDENLLVDLDILCYYAHSPLYEGTPEQAARLLTDCACSQGAAPGRDCGPVCFADVNGSGTVNAADLGLLLNFLCVTSGTPILTVVPGNPCPQVVCCGTSCPPMDPQLVAHIANLGALPPPQLLVNYLFCGAPDPCGGK